MVVNIDFLQHLWYYIFTISREEIVVGARFEFLDLKGCPIDRSKGRVLRDEAVGGTVLQCFDAETARAVHDWLVGLNFIPTQVRSMGELATLRPTGTEVRYCSADLSRMHDDREPVLVVILAGAPGELPQLEGRSLRWPEATVE
jgi:hypothetical protein